MGQMDTKQKQNAKRRANILESLKDLGSATADSLTQDLVKESGKDFAKQLFGSNFYPKPRHFSGEIMPQEQVGIDSILSGQKQKEEELQKQLHLERQLRAEEQALRDKKGNELKMALAALTQELQEIAKNTPNLSQEIQVAVIQAPSNPDIYSVFFIERLVQYLKGYNQKIEQTTVWLMALNRRAQKKGFWGQYKKHGGRRLLSAEDYSQRSAG